MYQSPHPAYKFPAAHSHAYEEALRRKRLGLPLVPLSHELASLARHKKIVGMADIIRSRESQRSLICRFKRMFHFKSTSLIIMYKRY